MIQRGCPAHQAGHVWSVLGGPGERDGQSSNEGKEEKSHGALGGP